MEETPEERRMIALFDAQRERMVEDQLAGRGIRDARVLEAFRRVPRHHFVPRDRWASSYEDRPIPVGQGQTISQPYIVAFMTESLDLRGGERVLEVGTGTGYQTAILAAMGARVCTVERLPEMQAGAARRLAELGMEVHEHLGDGTLGVPEEAPYDRIVVTAAAPSLPIALTSQLRDEGGIMVIPVGGEGEQDLVQVRRGGGFVRRRRLCGCAFVKLIGKEGW